jgi:hypothetical protein
MSTGRIVRLWFNADFDLFARDARLELANDRGIERDRLNAMTMTDVFPTRGTIVIVAGGVLIGNGVGELGYRIRPTSFLADTYAAIRAYVTYFHNLSPVRCPEWQQQDTIEKWRSQ